MAKNKPYKPKLSTEEITRRINELSDYLGSKEAAKRLNISERTLRRYKAGNLPKKANRIKEVVPKINKEYKRQEKRPDFTEKTEAIKAKKKPRPTPPPREKKWQTMTIYPDYMHSAGLFGIRFEERLEEINDKGYVAAWYGYPGEPPGEVVFTLDPDNPTDFDPGAVIHIVGVCTGNPSPKKGEDSGEYIVNSRIKSDFLWTMRGKSGEELTAAVREFFFLQKRMNGIKAVRFIGWYAEE